MLFNTVKYLNVNQKEYLSFVFNKILRAMPQKKMLKLNYVICTKSNDLDHSYSGNNNCNNIRRSNTTQPQKIAAFIYPIWVVVYFI
ncbi:hypothetical protein CSQ88_10175 [Iodobacter sp. BJB302]|nr:hypothetical protein CSQ88_10175 [Iodobacter sp. BJB302]